MFTPENVSIVAQKARDTFLNIKKLRRTMPHFTRAQKDQVDFIVKVLQDRWWEEVKPYMVKGKNDPPFCSECGEHIHIGLCEEEE